MNKYVFVTVFMCALALTNAKPSHDKEEENDSSPKSDLSEFNKIAQYVNDEYNTTVLLDAVKMIEKINEKCPNIQTQIDSVGEEVHNCMVGVELGNDTLCHMVKTHLVRCLKPIGVVINTCLPEESKGLPILVEKMVQGLINQACESTVEEILELFNPCIFETDTEDVHACQEADAVIEEYRNKLPSKSLVCHTLPKARNCVKAMVEGSCKNPITQNSVLKFHDAAEHAIKEDCDVLNKA
ncbi:unnamed protein product [Psylliodes chrysocephalus]|uniref:Uncharacterized protein n=1 Tax=Psylliodes chrysocephalus TaxID=3402493 RepID=A0A9P0CNM5_9CUCU|nr:unnamed protein product [Psylliodes chrysocephala]